MLYMRLKVEVMMRLLQVPCVDLSILLFKTDLLLVVAGFVSGVRLHLVLVCGTTTSTARACWGLAS